MVPLPRKAKPKHPKQPSKRSIFSRPEFFVGVAIIISVSGTWLAPHWLLSDYNINEQALPTGHKYKALIHPGWQTSATSFEVIKDVRSRFPEYRQAFPFTMQQSSACGNYLQNETLLRTVAHEARVYWQQEYHKPIEERTMSPTMLQAEEDWHAMMDACHGPLPSPKLDPDFAYNFTLRAFMDGLVRCGDKEVQRGGHESLFGGEWCGEGWRDRAQRGIIRNTMQFESDNTSVANPTEEAFLVMANCALKIEFPVIGPEQQQRQTQQHNNELPGLTGGSGGGNEKSTNRQRRPNWKPKRVILLTPTLGPRGASMGCKLASTAYVRGWEVVMIEGEHRGIRHKYTDAFEALELVVSHSNIAAEDTLVVLADSMDMLVQQPPEYVAEAFLDMTTEFAFSAESMCFPMASWPHSLGVPYHTCESKFPKSRNKYMGKDEPFRYANTGGWIGLASAAFVALEEISGVVQREGPKRDRPCHDHGTDQLLGNAAHLRAPNLIGLDSEWSVIASGSWHLLEKNELFLGPHHATPNLAYCNVNFTTDNSCPALLHFNGRGSDGGALSDAFMTLTSPESIKVCRPGKVLIANLTGGLLWDSKFEENPQFERCRRTNSCINKRSWLPATYWDKFNCKALYYLGVDLRKRWACSAHIPMDDYYGPILKYLRDEEWWQQSKFIRSFVEPMFRDRGWWSQTPK